jgi:uncharacterized protein (TIGR00251 family)
VVLLRVKVRPGARRHELAGVHGDALRVAVRAAPERGRANDAVCALVAETLSIRRRDVRVVSGAAARDKTLAIDGLTSEEVVGRLAAGATR